MMDFILIVIGFVVLIVGANWLVDGAVGVARRFRIPNIVIGLTIVAFGTSAPELVVNLVAALSPDTTDIALTNIIGSNMINTYVILGATALVCPIASQAASRRFDIPLAAAGPVLLMLLVWCSPYNRLSWVGGLVLLAVFGLFMYATLRKVRTLREVPEAEPADADTQPRHRTWISILLIVAGLALLVVGGRVIVDSATRIAVSWGISQAVIGLTIVALGTSLPELATSVVAAFKKNSDIALGNVIGSNIFNVFFILGVSSLMRPLPAYGNIMPDLAITALGGLLVCLFVSTNRQHEIKRWEGLLFLVLYGVYLGWMIGQG